MSQEDNIGKKIKDRLEGHEFPITGKLWENISKNLPPELASKPTDIPIKNVVNSSIHTTFITSITLLGIATIITVGLYIYSHHGKQTTAVFNVTSKQSLANTKHPAGVEQPFASTHLTKRSSGNEDKKSTVIVPSDANTLLKSSAQQNQNTSENKIKSKKSTVETKAIHIKPDESLTDKIGSANDKNFENKNQPARILQHADIRTKTESTGRDNTKNSVHNKNQAKYADKGKIKSYPEDSKGVEQIIDQEKDNIRKSKSTLIESQPKESQKQEESRNANPNQPVILDKSTSQLNSGINRIENYKYLQNKKQVADQLVTKYKSSVGQIKFFESQIIKTNTEANVDITDPENKIIPTKHKSIFSLSNLSVDALINRQYDFTTATDDSVRQDLSTHVQPRKAIVSGGIRINYHIPLRRSFLGESKITLSSGLLLERIQHGYIHRYTHTKLDSTYIPIYEWQDSGAGDSIKVIVDTVLSTNISKQLLSLTERHNATYVGVPLTFTYNWHRNKWSFYITAGAQMNILLNKKTTVTSRDTLQNVPSIVIQQIAYRRVVPLLTANAGVRYRITEKFSFIIEPSFKYGFTSIYKRHYALQQRLSILGINTGIRYHF